MPDNDLRLTLMYLAALMRETVNWADNELAIGTSPKWVSHQLIESIRYMLVEITKALG